MNEKLKEFFNLLICLAIIVGIAYSTGFMKNFSVDSLNKRVATPKRAVSKRSSVASINHYQPSNIPDSVAKSKYSLAIYNNIEKSGTKAIFYIYNDATSDKEFHYFIQNYLAKGSAKTSYNVFAYTYQGFKHIRLGEGGPSKICDSLQECNEQRQRAVDYTTAVNFFEKCGKTMCIIDPRKGQYIMLKRRDTDEAAKLLNSVKNW